MLKHVGIFQIIGDKHRNREDTLWFVGPSPSVRIINYLRLVFVGHDLSEWPRWCPTDSSQSYMSYKSYRQSDMSYRQYKILHVLPGRRRSAWLSYSWVTPTRPLLSWMFGSDLWDLVWNKMINEADIDIGCDRDTPVSSTHHVDTVSIGGRRLPDEVTVHGAPARVCEVVVPAVIPLSLVLQCHTHHQPITHSVGLTLLSIMSSSWAAPYWLEERRRRTVRDLNTCILLSSQDPLVHSHSVDYNIAQWWQPITMTWVTSRHETCNVGITKCGCWCCTTTLTAVHSTDTKQQTCSTARGTSSLTPPLSLCHSVRAGGLLMSSCLISLASLSPGWCVLPGVRQSCPSDGLQSTVWADPPAVQTPVHCTHQQSRQDQTVGRTITNNNIMWVLSRKLQE